MAQIKTYNLTSTGTYTAISADSTGTYQPSATSNAVSNATQLSADLATYSGWSSLAVGNHSIQLVAKANRYRDSNKSTAITFTKLPTLETPGNISVSGTSITFDSSSNASTYKVYANDTLIGEVQA